MISSLDYHKDTCYDRYRMEGHTLDWPNQPRLYKSYPENLENCPLPTVEDFPGLSLWQLQAAEASEAINLTDVSAILNLTQTFTARSRQPSGDFYYRSAASAGALYPNEIYLHVSAVQGLNPGVYHYDLYQKNLVRLRDKPHPHIIKEAMPESKATPPDITFFITGIFNRSSWKYRKRAYRYVLLDAGHVLQNMTFAFNAFTFPFSFGYDFVDPSVNQLLGLDKYKEVCLAWASIEALKKEFPEDVTETAEELPQSIKAASQTANIEVPYPQISDIHQAGSFEKQKDIKLAGQPKTLYFDTSHSQAITHQNVESTVLPYPDALFLRRSKRNFSPADISLDKVMQLLALLDRQSRPNKQDHKYANIMSTGFLANHIPGLENGFYLCDFHQHQFGLVETGTYNHLMAAICLEQAWLKNANLHFLFMANLKEVDDTVGARGYRYAMMEAGRLGQTLYVGATALGLGCCGIGALFDHEAQQLLSLDASSFLLYLVAVGPTKS